MMSPTAPAACKNLVWYTYSAQAYGMYAGDLDFYFGGFDYRGKLESIDTTKIPVAMLTGEYDWVSKLEPLHPHFGSLAQSCRPEMSLATAAKIKGAWISEW
jgi:hypothetical protein